MVWFENIHLNGVPFNHVVKRKYIFFLLFILVNFSLPLMKHLTYNNPLSKIYIICVSLLLSNKISFTITIGGGEKNIYIPVIKFNFLARKRKCPVPTWLHAIGYHPCSRTTSAWSNRWHKLFWHSLSETCEVNVQVWKFRKGMRQPYFLNVTNIHFFFNRTSLKSIFIGAAFKWNMLPLI